MKADLGFETFLEKNIFPFWARLYRVQAFKWNLPYRLIYDPRLKINIPRRCEKTGCDYFLAINGRLGFLEVKRTGKPRLAIVKSTDDPGLAWHQISFLAEHETGGRFAAVLWECCKKDYLIPISAVIRILEETGKRSINVKEVKEYQVGDLVNFWEEHWDVQGKVAQ